MLDSHLLHALHVQAVRHSELPAGSQPHALFQVSTIEALLHGAQVPQGPGLGFEVDMGVVQKYRAG